MSGRGSELPALFILSRSYDVYIGLLFIPLRPFLTLCIICIHESRKRTTLASMPVTRAHIFHPVSHRECKEWKLDAYS